VADPYPDLIGRKGIMRWIRWLLCCPLSYPITDKDDDGKKAA
jgi:hypothetical protein